MTVVAYAFSEDWIAAVRLALRRAGAQEIVSTDSSAHPTNAIHLAPLLAGALRQELTACP